MRILTADGGGIRGVITARVLERLDQARPNFLAKTEFFAGTSTGSIVALCLAKGMKPAEIVTLYKKIGPVIFKPRDFLDRISGGSDELFRADYTQGELEKVLKQVFGNAKLGDLPKRVSVPAFCIDNQATPPAVRHWKPKYFHNFEGPGNDRHVLAYEVALRSSAAPTYFPTRGRYVDGGVMDNNPAMSALAKAVNVEGRDALKNMRLLSMGTGFNARFIDGQDLDWGLKDWASGKRILNMLFDGMLGVPDYQVRQLLNGDYYRFDMTLVKTIDLDEADRIDEMLGLADKFDLGPLLAWADSRW